MILSTTTYDVIHEDDGEIEDAFVTDNDLCGHIENYKRDGRPFMCYDHSADIFVEMVDVYTSLDARLALEIARFPCGIRALTLKNLYDTIENAGKCLDHGYSPPEVLLWAVITR